MLRALVLAALAAMLGPTLASPEPLFLAPGSPALAGEPPAGTVSAGAEPTMLVARSGALLVGDTSGLRRSVDGGLTWTRSANPFLPGLFNDGWSLAQDDAGTLYASTTQGQVIGVAASRDDGRTWSTVTPVAGAGGIADRPWLAAGGDGRVALVWYQAGAGEWCAYSTDGGLTFLARSTSNIGFSNAGNLVMDPDGSLWYATDYAVLTWDAGCANPQRAAQLPPSGPQIFIQLARTPGGDSFVAQPSADGTAMELRAFHGLDRASLKRLVVSPPTLRANSFGAVAALGDDEVAVAWYGSASPGNPSSSSYQGEWRVYVARVTGYWTATPTVEVTQVTSTPNHRGWFCMGGLSCTGGRALLDYFGIDHDAAGNLHVAYGHDAGTSAQVRHAVVPK